LLFVDHVCDKSVLFMLRHAVHTTALSSLQESRQAHSWDRVKEESQLLPEILLDDYESIVGLALGAVTTDLTLVTTVSLYVTAKKGEDIILLRMDLAEADDDAEEQGVRQQGETETIMNLSGQIPSIKEPGPIAIDRENRIYLGCSDGVLIIDLATRIILGKLETPFSPVSLTLGEDGFLYIATSTSLLRIRIRHGHMQAPTNVVVKPTKMTK
jgi:hypothetical protein